MLFFVNLYLRFISHGRVFSPPPASNDVALRTLHHYDIKIFFSARCNIYISRLCYDTNVCLSVRLSVTEVHCRNIANLAFQIPIQIYRAAHNAPGATASRSACGHIVVAVHAEKREGSSRAMLAIARPSILLKFVKQIANSL